MSNVKFLNILLFKMEKVNCIVGVMHAHAELVLVLPPPDIVNIQSVYLHSEKTCSNFKDPIDLITQKK